MRLMWGEGAILWQVLADAVDFNLREMYTDLSAVQTKMRLKCKTSNFQSCEVRG